jgi:hypothetical protein
MITSPSVGAVSIWTSLSTVVLPAPDGPVRKTNSALRTWKETSASAVPLRG